MLIWTVLGLYCLRQELPELWTLVAAIGAKVNIKHPHLCLANSVKQDPCVVSGTTAPHLIILYDDRLQGVILL